METPPELVTAAAKLVGWVLLHSLWQGTVIALALALALLALRGRSAASRHSACLLALSALPLSSAATAWRLRPEPAASIPVHPVQAVHQVHSSLPASPEAEPIDRPAQAAAPLPTASVPPAAREIYPPALQRIEPALPWISAAWLAGVLLLSLRHAGGWWRIREMRSSSGRVTPQFQRIFDSVAERLGIRGSAQVLESLQAATPMLTGFIKPIVLLPSRVLSGLPATEIEAIIAHELAHLARRDPWTNLLQIFVETVFFFHPAVWWIAHRARAEREHAADDLALSVCADRRVYAGVLARLAEWQLPSQPALAASGGDLLTRVRRILSPAQSEPVVGGWSFGLPAVIAVIAIGGVFAARAADENVIEVAPDQSIQAAVDSAPAGAVIRLKEGEWKQRVLITKPLTIEGAGSDKTRITIEEPDPKESEKAAQEIQAQQNEEQKTAMLHKWFKQFGPAFSIRGTQDVELRGLRIQGVSNHGPDDGMTASVLVHFDKARGTITDCAVVGPFGNGIELRDGSEAEISRTLVAAIWSNGILVSGRGRDQTSTPSRLHLSDSEVRNVYHYGIAIGGGCDSTVIERCRISGAAWHGIRYDNASPTITGNTIFMNARFGIYASGKTAATVKGNLFWKNEMSGMSCWMDNTDTIEGNTFVGNLREGLAVLGGSKPTVARNIFANNPIAITCAMIASRTNQPTPTGEPVLTANLFHENPVVLQVGVEKKDAPEGSVVADPMFKDPANGEFALAADSPARKANIGAADPLSPASPVALLPEEKGIIPAEETRDYRSWSAPGAPKTSQSAEQAAAKAYADSKGLVADAFQLDDKAKREAAIESVRQAMLSDDAAKARTGVAAFVQLAPIEFDKASFRPAVRKLLSSPDVPTRATALRAFAITGADPEDLPQIFALADDPAAEVRSPLTIVIVQLMNHDLTGKEPTQAILKLMANLPRDARDVAHALWGAKFSPEIEAKVLEFCRDENSEVGYNFFYGSLSTQANKSEASVKRLIEILANPDTTNRAGRAAWGLQQGVAKEQYPLVADAMLKVIEARSDGYLRNNALKCLRVYGDASNVRQINELLAKPGVTGDFRKSLEATLETIQGRSAAN